MRMKTIAMLGVLLIGLSRADQVLDAQANTVQVSFPAFPVVVNGTYMDVKHSEYPPILYKDVTYFPMTWKNTSALGLAVSWDSAEGLSLQKKGACASPEQDLVPQTNADDTVQAAELTPFSVQVNGKSIDNAKETYPVLLFRSVTYFPMTWRFIHDEFGWKTSWDAARGLSIESCEEQTDRQAEQTDFFNITNGGLVAVQGDWIYANEDRNKLIKFNKNGGEEIKLADDNAVSINIVGEWLYYVAAGSEGGIYKIKTDGTQRSRIVNAPDAVSTIRVKDNSIYYVHRSFQDPEGATGGDHRPDGIRKMNIDGTGDELLVGGKINYYMALHGDKIYYLLEEGAAKHLYVMNLDGSGQTRLQDDVLRMTVVDGWIYFAQDNQLGKMSLDGSVVIPLYKADKVITALSYRDGWIYLARGLFGIQGAATIERIRVDGSGLEEIAMARTTSLYFAGNTLYFQQDNKLGGSYRLEHIDIEKSPDAD
ncbi:DUF5050 domain-containing protein [Paenibacillus hamazuiensis]|uniref:DUF5050 domain-containing protein n=1 Tax=Paenibacillus hamazuiensis TaxID=2936508 RepID=UPI00200D1876|nr:DUF5050 domain-containing protein [Paenibacillus hamazuiensis]